VLVRLVPQPEFDTHAAGANDDRLPHSRRRSSLRPSGRASRRPPPVK
jgi:hypothetical protein